MKINYIIPVLSAVILGYLCANYVISEYNTNLDTRGSNVYFLQIASYNDYDSTNDKYPDIKNKLTIKEGNKYCTYIGITMDKKEDNRIKELYSKNKIDLYIKTIKINNVSFINELEQYDVLLKNSKTKEEIDQVLRSILSSYEEILNNN